MSCHALACITLCVSLLHLGCENTKRSMVFFTGTTLGIEIAFEPNSTAPAKFIVGYKRAEGLLDPIMEDACGHDNGYIIKSDPHSVLAKIAGEVKSGSGVANPSLQGAQWFASGEAAEILARHPATAAVLTNNPQVAQAVAQIAGLGARVDSTVARRALSTIYDGLGRMKDDPMAAAHVKQLDVAAQSLLTPERRGLDRLYKNFDAGGKTVQVEDYSFSLSSKPFQDAIGLQAAWESSANELVKASAHLADPSFRVQTDDTDISDHDAARATAVSHLATYPRIADAFQRELRTNEQILAAAKYYATTLFE